MGRSYKLERKTRETDISLEINLDGSGISTVSTGLGFFDHMLTAVSTHSKCDLNITCQGDLHIDDHHSVEDCAIAFGAAVSEALGDRKGIMRYGYAYAPLDEALARAVIDLSGRAYADVSLELERDKIGDVACENLEHVFESFAMNARAAVHIDVLKGTNDHHRAEAAFKAFALALRQAVARSGDDSVPSTKGVL